MSNNEWIDVRPSWDTWFMTLAFCVSQRSLDQHTKHGCVVVSKDKTILCVGYNGPPRGCDDSQIPLERPMKYRMLCHSEINAISNAARHGISLNESKFYITGHPCPECLRSIINVGAKHIVYGHVPSQCISENDKQLARQMLEHQPIVFESFTKIDEINHLVSILSDRLKHISAE